MSEKTLSWLHGSCSSRYKIASKSKEVPQTSLPSKSRRDSEHAWKYSKVKRSRTITAGLQRNTCPSEEQMAQQAAEQSSENAKVTNRTSVDTRFLGAVDSSAAAHKAVKRPCPDYTPPKFRGASLDRTGQCADDLATAIEDNLLPLVEHVSVCRQSASESFQHLSFTASASCSLSRLIE